MNKLKDLPAGRKTMLSKLFFCFYLSVIMAACLWFTVGIIEIGDNDRALVTVSFTLIYLAGLALSLFSVRTEEIPAWLLLGAGLAALVYMRVCMAPMNSEDAQTFSNWIADMRPYPGLKGLLVLNGSYNMPYMYILLIISKFRFNDMYAVKAVSCLFDILLAYAAMKTVSLISKSPAVQAMSFLLTLAIPSALFNSALWGQCDSIYVAFCLMSVYCAVKGRSRASAIYFAVAFAFKLQAVFVIPVLFIFFLLKRIRPLHILWLPAVYILFWIPALIAGVPASQMLSIYATQTVTYPRLVMNTPSLYCLFGTGLEFKNMNQFALMLAGCVTVMLIYLAWHDLKKIGTVEMIYFFLLSVLILPYFLPRMHDRYFFLADIASFILFFFDRKQWYQTIVICFSSFNSYMYYFDSSNLLVDQKYMSLALMVVIILTLRALMNRLALGGSPDLCPPAVDDPGKNKTFLSWRKKEPGKAARKAG